LAIAILVNTPATLPTKQELRNTQLTFSLTVRNMKGWGDRKALLHVSNPHLIDFQFHRQLSPSPLEKKQ